MTPPETCGWCRYDTKPEEWQGFVIGELPKHMRIIDPVTVWQHTCGGWTVNETA